MSSINGEGEESISWRKVKSQQNQIGEVEALSEDIIRELETQAVTNGKVWKPEFESTPAAREFVDPILRTNYPPSQEAILSLKTSLAQKADNIEAIDHNLFRLQLKMNDLIKEFKVLTDAREFEEVQYNFRKYLLSPVRRIPPEILVRIFQYAVYTEGARKMASTIPSFIRRTSSPLVLSQVCSTWRYAAFGLPTFWNDLDMTISSWKRLQPGTITAEVTAWFHRASGVRPLNLALIVRAHPNGAVVEDLSQSLTMWGHRLRHLTITFLGGLVSPLDPFLSSSAGSLTSLEELHLSMDDSSNETPVSSPVTVFNNSPLLRTVSISGFSHSMLSNASLLLLPWAQIHKLEVTGRITVQSFVTVLFQCQQLRSATFTRIDLSETIKDPTRPRLSSIPQTFAQLEELHIALAGKEDEETALFIEDVLPLLDLPRLHTLKLSGSTHLIPSAFPMFALIPGLIDCAHTLRHLSLCLFDASSQELIGLLSSCAVLETLALFDFSFSPMALLRAINSACSFPCLREFTLAFAQFKAMPLNLIDFEEELFSFAKAPSRASLCTLKIQISRDLSDTRETDAMRAMGAELSTRLEGIQFELDVEATIISIWRTFGIKDVEWCACFSAWPIARTSNHSSRMLSRLAGVMLHTS
ncbi:hypothetical protein H0H81_005220 [Sphagnurus paluster]|uniref:F-box domain-containing protein n=1 Tax=Sphagnurus paluster TaxID=117069 RepID=A0A9P7K3Y0_9AGAR|nr:hypothetical protein H0H81_005220 [Sphagnurus paluster]